MSADYFFIGLGSNNLKDKAFNGRMKSLGQQNPAQTRKARIDTCFQGGVHICPGSFWLFPGSSLALALFQLNLAVLGDLGSRAIPWRQQIRAVFVGGFAQHNGLVLKVA